jgi:hypothetical protein
VVALDLERDLTFHLLDLIEEQLKTNRRERRLAGDLRLEKVHQQQADADDLTQHWIHF